MPITREQFDQGLDNSAQRILKFLNENPNNAYEPSEIAEAMEDGLPPDNSLWRGLTLLAETWQYHAVLEDLVGKGLVNKKIIKGVPWYCIHKA